jgi:hypothetical protein
MIRLHHEKGRYPQGTGTLFDWDELDPYFTEDVNVLLYGAAWESVLVEDGTNAFLHAYAINPISDSGFYDIEPLLGYSGPLANTGEGEFLRAALAEYSRFCRERGVVAELVRFNPLLRNHEPLTGQCSGLRLIERKPIAYIRLSRDPETLLAGYSQKCRNMVRHGMKCFASRVLDKSGSDWDLFTDLYRRSIRTLGTGPEWLFDDPFFERLRASERTWLIGTFSGVGVVNASVLLVGRKVSYDLFSANNYEAPYRSGANNAAVHFAATQLAERGCSWLCMGGGNSDDPKDSLMRYKALFASDIRPFPLGFFSHNEPKLTELYGRADTEDPGAASARLFLRYRLAPSFRAGRMKPAASAQQEAVT